MNQLVGTNHNDCAGTPAAPLGKSGAVAAAGLVYHLYASRSNASRDPNSSLAEIETGDPHRCKRSVGQDDRIELGQPARSTTMNRCPRASDRNSSRRARTAEKLFNFRQRQAPSS